MGHWHPRIFALVVLPCLEGSSFLDFLSPVELPLEVLSFKGHFKKAVSDLSPLPSIWID